MRQQTHKTKKQNQATTKNGRAISGPDRGVDTIGREGTVAATVEAVATAELIAKLSQYGEDPGTTSSYTHRALTGLLAGRASEGCGDGIRFVELNTMLG
jgi:hypothetical protein